MIHSNKQEIQGITSRVYRRQDLVKSLIFIFALTFYIIIVDIRHKCNVFYFELKKGLFSYINFSLIPLVLINKISYLVLKERQLAVFNSPRLFMKVNGF